MSRGAPIMGAPFMVPLKEIREEREAAIVLNVVFM
jgi:hypothetical protein